MNLVVQIEKWRQVYAPNPAMLRHTLVAEGYDVFQWCEEQGKILVRHKCHRHKSFWVVTGEIEIDIEGFGICLLGAGDRNIIPAETYHSARFVSEEPVLYLVGEKNAE
jgi:quercetin dioxygenase-like cupin family protein